MLGGAATALVEAFGVEGASAWVWGTLAVLAAMCAASGVCAILITQRSQVARWTLVALSAVTIAVSAIVALTIFVSVANLVVAGAVLVLLLLPDSGRWFARSAA